MRFDSDWPNGWVAVGAFIAGLFFAVVGFLTVCGWVAEHVSIR